MQKLHGEVGKVYIQNSAFEKELKLAKTLVCSLKDDFKNSPRRAELQTKFSLYPKGKAPHLFGRAT